MCLWLYRCYGVFPDEPVPCVDVCDPSSGVPQICLEVPSELPVCGSQAWKDADCQIRRSQHVHARCLR